MEDLSKMGLQSKIEKKLRPVAVRTHPCTLFRLQKSLQKHLKCRKSTLKNKNFKKKQKSTSRYFGDNSKMGLQSKIGKKLRAVALWTDGQTDRLFASPGKLTTITNL